MRFLPERIRKPRIRVTGLDQEFKPKNTFVSLFFNSAHLRPELGGAATAACGAIIRRNRCSRSRQLFSEDIRCSVAR